MGSADWTEVAAVATAGAALATAWMAWKTRDLASAARQDADASVRLVEEAQRDRELSHRPYLTIPTLVETGITQGTRFPVRNVGTGPAIGCLTVIADVHGAWMASTATSDIPVGQEATVGLQQARSDVPDYFAPPLGSRGALFCRDVLDQRHAFLLRTNSENQVVVFASQSFRVPAEKDEEHLVPPWVTAPRLWQTANP